MTPFGKIVVATGMTIVAALSLSGCATEDYVDKHIAIVNDRVTGLEGRVQEVNGIAQGAAASAQQANASAQQANQRLDQLTPRVDAIEQQLAKKKPRN